MIRQPAVAGTFYQGDPESLRKQIKWCFKHELGPGHTPENIGKNRQIKSMVVPHAGYMYSGPVAAHAYLKLALDGLPDTFIIICPNHTGMGSGVSIVAHGAWETPLGLVEIDTEFALKLQEKAPIIDAEPLAHHREHSCEVQLPFLQYLGNISGKEIKMVPICIWMQDLETATEIGEALSDTCKELGRDAVVVASTDFTHYQPQEIAENNDQQVLEAIENLDEKALMGKVQELNITMCGCGTVTSALIFSKAMGAHSAEILKYATSGDTTQDYSAVVGYASAVIR